MKEFGIFQDFQWDSSVNTYKKDNLIYGWNYSGKTTISKLFQNLESKSNIHFPEAEYAIEIEASSSSCTQDNLESFPYPVKVFNSLYSEKIFSWYKDNVDGIEAIFFYLDEKVPEIQPRINQLKSIRKKRIENYLESQQEKIETYNEYIKENGKFSKQATEIRKYLNDQIKASEFNKGHLAEYAENIKTNLILHIRKPDEVQAIKDRAIALNEFMSIDRVNFFDEKLNALGVFIKQILEDRAPETISFPELDGDTFLFNWVQQGLEIHKQTEECKFCNNIISADRIESLNKYYSKKLIQIQESLKSAKEKINLEKNKLHVTLPHVSQIAKHLRDEYLEFVKEFEYRKGRYLEVLSLMESDLIKKGENLFVGISPSPYVLVYLNDCVDGINNIINKHNLFISKFEDEKAKARIEILKHYVAEYLLNEDFLSVERNKNTARIRIDRGQRLLQSIIEEINYLEASLNDSVKGQDELNKMIKLMLNRDDIRIGIEKDKFVLLRGDQFAASLSEGEKTAVALSYFLTQLKSLNQEGSLKNTIIFIDDPISSLDSNHIFQVRSLLTYHFLDILEYRQLFISTHNFEFFSVLLDSDIFKNLNQKSIKLEKCPFYLVSRWTEKCSKIQNLPLSLRSHKSEYAYLFFILKEYCDSTNKDEFEYKIILPNALRRFLELYTLFKFPKGFSSIDDRLKVILEPTSPLFHTTKLYHWFSHQQKFENVAYQDGKIILIDDAIKEVLEHIETNDPLHWRGLVG